MLHCDVCFEVKPADKIRGMRAFLLSEDAHFYTLGFMTQSVNPDEILMMSYQSRGPQALIYRNALQKAPRFFWGQTRRSVETLLLP